jgi:hypothetical protein
MATAVARLGGVAIGSAARYAAGEYRIAQGSSLMRKFLYVAGVVAVVALAGVGGLVVYAPGWLKGAESSTAGSAAVPDIDSERGAEPAESGEATGQGGDRAARKEGPYEPTSEYVAKGFDPGKQVIDFSESKGGEASGPGEDILTTGNVHRILHERANKLIPCYQKVLDERPDASGEVGFEFGIDSGGGVKMVRVTDSELESRKAEDCMVEKTRGWSFPETGMGSVTTFETSMTFRLQ